MYYDSLFIVTSICHAQASDSSSRIHVRKIARQPCSVVLMSSLTSVDLLSGHRRPYLADVNECLPTGNSFPLYILKMKQHPPVTARSVTQRQHQS